MVAGNDYECFGILALKLQTPTYGLVKVEDFVQQCARVREPIPESSQSDSRRDSGPGCRCGLHATINMTLSSSRTIFFEARAVTIIPRLGIKSRAILSHGS